jgi:putative protease
MLVNQSPMFKFVYWSKNGSGLETRIELLAPAGSYDKMRYALAYGADAVYAGLPRFSLRARENEFDKASLEKAVEYVQNLGKKIYLTMNIFSHSRKINDIRAALKWVRDLRPDGIILSDPGIIYLARKICPSVPIHLSTQANTLNWVSVEFWRENGVSRIILSRELSLEEITEIRGKVKQVELECFIHGAICIAYSGRCLLSNYFSHRDPNQGTCTNSCRWEYHLYKNEQFRQEPPDIFFLEENKRPGYMMPIDEDEHGTYIMNARDLSTIHLLNRLIATGINSLKIEGRTKSVYYLSVITRAYRRAIDAILAGKPVAESEIEEVFAVANRGYTTGFLEKNPGSSGLNYEKNSSEDGTKIFCGIIRELDGQAKKMRISVRNRFEVGDVMELMAPDDDRLIRVDHIYNEEGKPLSVAHGGGQDVWIPTDVPVNPYALLRKSNKNHV